MGGTAVSAHNGINSAVIVNVTDGHSSAHPGLPKNVPCCGRNIHKLLACVSCQQHGFTIMQFGKTFLDRIEIMPLSNQQILPSVVVKIYKPQTPARMEHRHAADACEESGVIEGAIMFVVVHGIPLVRQVSDQ